jgi:hypothetical protein
MNLAMFGFMNFIQKNAEGMTMRSRFLGRATHEDSSKIKFVFFITKKVCIFLNFT